MSTILFLNGCSSAGKTSLALSLQHLSETPFLRVGVDTLVDMMPSQYVGRGERAQEGYYAFVPKDGQRGPSLRVEEGPLGKKVFPCLPLIARTLADHGNDVIIDEVLLGDELGAYREALADHRVYFIGVVCDLERMQEREVLRGDRALGLVNDQVDRVHEGVSAYDLTIDTSHLSSFTAARVVLTLMENHRSPQAFHTMCAS